MDHLDFIAKIERSRPLFEKICGSISLPRMRRVRQLFPRDEVTDVAGTVRAELDASGMKAAIKKGGRIAVCVGSRGMADLPLLVKTTVEWVREQGGEPFIVPAMGSHGGATAEGQAAMIDTLGVNEKTVGAPVVSNMETRVIGETREGVRVHMAEDILNSDGCLFVCRVKPHSAFRGEFESGYMKMLAIGMGKHNSALAVHRKGFGAFREVIPQMGLCAMEKAPVIGGVGTVENAFFKIASIRALRCEQFLTEEPPLLQESFRLMGSIFPDDLDALLVDTIGKNFSGDGMDPNVTGAFGTPYASGGLKAESRVIFGLSEETHGNAIGLGMADYITLKVFREFDPASTYVNAMTTRVNLPAKIPLVMPDERIAIRMAIHNSLREEAQENPRVVHIPNTEYLEFIHVSEALWKTVDNDDRLRFAGEAFAYEFDDAGEIRRHWEKQA